MDVYYSTETVGIDVWNDGIASGGKALFNPSLRLRFEAQLYFMVTGCNTVGCNTSTMVQYKCLHAAFLNQRVGVR